MDYYAPENWRQEDAATFSQDRIDRVKRYLDREGYVVVLHKHFCGAQAPTPLAFDDSDDFEEYCTSAIRPGDKIQVWPFPGAEPLVAGTWPNETGEVPVRGAY